MYLRATSIWEYPKENIPYPFCHANRARPGSFVFSHKLEARFVSCTKRACVQVRDSAHKRCT